MNKKSARVLEDVSSCKLCPMLGHDHVPAEGPVPCEVMVIGQSPGSTEVEQCRPFVGPAGELLDLMLEEAGLSREEVYLTNVLKCHPPGNRSAYHDEAKNCYTTWLKREIKLVNPRLVILLGKDAHNVIVGARNSFGHAVVTRSRKRTYLTFKHPAYFLRQGRVFDFIDSGRVVADLLSNFEETVEEDES